MRYRMGYVAILALLLSAHGVGGITELRASGLVDWISRCGRPEEPQYVCYPMTAMYATSVSDCCQPDICCQSPGVVCCPPVAVYQPRPSCWLSDWWGSRATVPVLGGIPQTYYRTSWKQVPVTSYRPVVSTDPVTGCPVTVLQPCMTYTWQAERRRCGFFGRLFGWCDPPAPALECCTPSVCCDPCGSGSPVVSGGCWESAPPSAAPVPATPAPYYAPSQPSVLTPSQGAGTPTLVPSTPSAPTLAPGVPPSTSGSYPAVQPPAADVRPSLKPIDVPPAATRDDAWPSTDLPGEPTPPAEPAVTDPPSLQPVPSLGPPIVNPEQSRVHPVPGPNATPVVPVERDEPPPLVHRGDQVASVPSGPSGAVVPAVWPASVRKAEGRVPASEARRDWQVWDESGWKSARKTP